MIALVLVIPFLAQAQTDTTYKPHDFYCMIVASGNQINSNVKLSVDFGQRSKIFLVKEKGIKEEAEKVTTFNSIIDALNYMSSQGWYFVNAYTLSEETGGIRIVNYLMRRPNHI